MNSVVIAGGHSKHSEGWTAAEAIFSAIGIGDREERESSNYFEGRYFRDKIDGVEIRVSMGDSDYPDLPIWIIFEGSEDITVTNVVDRTVRELRIVGFRLVRLDAFGTMQELRVEL